MQSTTQTNTGRKNPYLTQYKNDISAKQREIRQRLGYETTTNNQSTATNGNKSLRQSKDNIPSIDDEVIEQESQMPRQYRQLPSSYQDEEAEASLQFFKRNLLPKSAIEKSPATGPSNIDTHYSSIPSSNRDLSKKILSSTNEESQAQIAPHVKERISTTLNKQVSDRFTRPVPFKQTTLINAPRTESLTAQAKPNLPNEFPSYHDTRKSSSPNNKEKPSHERVNSLRASSQGPRQPRSTPQESSDIVSNIDQVADTKSRQSIGDRQSTGSPNTLNGSFSRKPLYNSLLRAHDSIRLKVNRPKVRPKSEVMVDDTELDDSIPLAVINTSSDLNERPVDVKRSSSRRKSKSKNENKTSKEDPESKKHVRNFSTVRVVKVLRSETERSLGVTVRADDGNIVVARIMAGSLADKQGALQVGDVILSVNNREVYTPEQLQEQLKETINDDTVVMKIVPSFREELPTLCIYLRALFNYDANEDSLLPCKEVGVSFNQGDILEVVNQEDPNWWQARRVDSENLQTGLIPSQELEERRRAFVIPDYDLATRTSICGTKVTRKSKKKEIYNVGQNCDFDKAELQLYEEVCRTPAFERRTLVLIGSNGVGKQALKSRLVTMDPDRFGTPLPHTSRAPRDGEEDGIHYHFVSREKMEEDIIDGKYLEFGEYDGALYGTKLDSVREIIGSGRVCVLDCSATCLKILKTSDYLPFVAFIAAPTLDQLRYMHEFSRNSNRNYTTLDRALSRQSRRARTLQDFAFDFFEDEDLQATVEESARLFRVYENYFNIVLVNNNFERTFEQLKDAIDALSMAPQWIPISWIYGT